MTERHNDQPRNWADPDSGGEEFVDDAARGGARDAAAADVLYEENWNTLHAQAAILADPNQPGQQRADAASRLGELIHDLPHADRRDYMAHSGADDIRNLAALIRQSSAQGTAPEPLHAALLTLIELREPTGTLTIAAYRRALQDPDAPQPASPASDTASADAEPVRPPLSASEEQQLDAHLETALDAGQPLPLRANGFERLSSLVRRLPPERRASFFREQGGALADAAADLVDQRAELAHAAGDASRVPLELAARFLQDIADLASPGNLSQADIARMLGVERHDASPASPLDRLLDHAGVDAVDRSGLTVTVIDLLQNLPIDVLGTAAFHWSDRLNQVGPIGNVADVETVAALGEGFNALDRMVDELRAPPAHDHSDESSASDGLSVSTGVMDEFDALTAALQDPAVSAATRLSALMQLNDVVGDFSEPTRIHYYLAEGAQLTAVGVSLLEHAADLSAQIPAAGMAPAAELATLLEQLHAATSSTGIPLGEEALGGLRVAVSAAPGAEETGLRHIVDRLALPASARQAGGYGPEGLQTAPSAGEDDAGVVEVRMMARRALAIVHRHEVEHGQAERDEGRPRSAGSSTSSSSELAFGPPSGTRSDGGTVDAELASTPRLPDAGTHAAKREHIVSWLEQVEPLGRTRTATDDRREVSEAGTVGNAASRDAYLQRSAARTAFLERGQQSSAARVPSPANAAAASATVPGALLLGPNQTRHLLLQLTEPVAEPSRPGQVLAVARLLEALASFPVAERADILLHPPVARSLTGMAVREAQLPMAGNRGEANALPLSTVVAESLRGAIEHALAQGQPERVLAAVGHGPGGADRDRSGRTHQDPGHGTALGILAPARFHWSLHPLTDLLYEDLLARPEVGRRLREQRVPDEAHRGVPLYQLLASQPRIGRYPPLPPSTRSVERPPGTRTATDMATAVATIADNERFLTPGAQRIEAAMNRSNQAQQRRREERHARHVYIHGVSQQRLDNALATTIAYEQHRQQRYAQAREHSAVLRSEQADIQAHERARWSEALSAQASADSLQAGQRANAQRHLQREQGRLRQRLANQPDARATAAVPGAAALAGGHATPGAVSPGGPAPAVEAHGHARAGNAVAGRAVDVPRGSRLGDDGQLIVPATMHDGHTIRPGHFEVGLAGRAPLPTLVVRALPPPAPPVLDAMTGQPSPLRDVPAPSLAPQRQPPSFSTNDIRQHQSGISITFNAGCADEVVTLLPQSSLRALSFHFQDGRLELRHAPPAPRLQRDAGGMDR